MAMLYGKLGRSSSWRIERTIGSGEHMVLPECSDEVFGQEYLLVLAIQQVVLVLV